MTLSTLYAFLGHDVLGNALAALLVAGLGYTAKKIRAAVRNRNRDTAPIDQPDHIDHIDDSNDADEADDADQAPS